ncbi:MAG: ATP-dependent DNA ligase [archaeon]
MRYSDLVETYRLLESTAKRLEKTHYISELLQKTPTNDLDKIILLIQGKVYPSWDSRKIGVASRLIIKAINLSTGIRASEIETTWKNTGDLGIVAEMLVAKKKQTTLFTEELTVAKVFQNLQGLSALQGHGAVDKKIQLISQLITSAKPLEARYLVRTVLEELRVGAGEGSLRDAIVWSTFPRISHLFFRCSGCGKWMPSVPTCISCGTLLDLKQDQSAEPGGLRIAGLKGLESKDLLRRPFILASDEKLARAAYNRLSEAVQEAVDLSNDFSVVAAAAREGLAALGQIGLRSGRPVKVMLAQKVKGIDDGLEKVGVPAEVEYKYDGFRMQIHKSGSKLKIFTRRLEEVTDQFPEVLEFIKKNVSGSSYILDAEAVGYDGKTGKYLPFQSISQRIRRKHNIIQMANSFPVELNIFDILLYAKKSLLKTPFADRRALLEKVVTSVPKKIVLAKNLVTADPALIDRFYSESLGAGNEGIMLKKVDAVYKPGSRVGYMVKLKPVMETLDLVITGAEWGEGKRANWLTTFKIACIDEDGIFHDLGKVGTGIKEIEGSGVTFSQLTEALQPLIISENGKVVDVKPEVVIEVHYEEIQKSPTYGSGYALRFPRLIALRLDRSPDDCSTLGAVHDLYRSQAK